MNTTSAIRSLYIIGILTCAKIAAKDADLAMSFENKEGFKPGMQAASSALSATDGTFTVIEGAAPEGNAFLRFEGTTDDSLGLVALPRRSDSSFSKLSFALRAPFTVGGEDRDYVVAAGAVVGIAQTEQSILVSFPLDRTGEIWRELRLFHDQSITQLPADWSQFEIRRDPEGKHWDLIWNRRVLASGLPVAGGLEGDDVLAISGLGPVSIDDVQLAFADSARPFPADTTAPGRKSALELRDQHKKADKKIATDAKGRRGPAWGRTADPGATRVGEQSAASTPTHLELFLPKP